MRGILSLYSDSLRRLEAGPLKRLRGRNIFGLHEGIEPPDAPLRERPVGSQLNQPARVTQAPGTAVHRDIDVGLAGAAFVKAYLSHRDSTGIQCHENTAILILKLLAKPHDVVIPGDRFGR